MGNILPDRANDFFSSMFGKIMGCLLLSLLSLLVLIIFAPWNAVNDIISPKFDVHHRALGKSPLERAYESLSDALSASPREQSRFRERHHSFSRSFSVPGPPIKAEAPEVKAPESYRGQPTAFFITNAMELIKQVLDERLTPVSTPIPKHPEPSRIASNYLLCTPDPSDIPSQLFELTALTPSRPTAFRMLKLNPCSMEELAKAVSNLVLRYIRKLTGSPSSAPIDPRRRLLSLDTVGFDLRRFRVIGTCKRIIDKGTLRISDTKSSIDPKWNYLYGGEFEVEGYFGDRVDSDSLMPQLENLEVGNLLIQYTIIEKDSSQPFELNTDTILKVIDSSADFDKEVQVAIKTGAPDGCKDCENINVSKRQYHQESYQFDPSYGIILLMTKSAYDEAGAAAGSEPANLLDTEFLISNLISLSVNTAAPQSFDRGRILCNGRFEKKEHASLVQGSFGAGFNKTKLRWLERRMEPDYILVSCLLRGLADSDDSSVAAGDAVGRLLRTFRMVHFQEVDESLFVPEQEKEVETLPAAFPAWIICVGVLTPLLLVGIFLGTIWRLKRCPLLPRMGSAIEVCGDNPSIASITEGTRDAQVNQNEQRKPGHKLWLRAGYKLDSFLNRLFA